MALAEIVLKFKDRKNNSHAPINSLAAMPYDTAMRG
jgi:hypothetical protein